MKKMIIYSLCGLGILFWGALALLVQTPASVLADQLQKQSQGVIVLTGVQGTAWRGQAQTVSYRQQPVLTQAEWQLSPWRLILGQAAFTVKHTYAEKTSQVYLIASYKKVNLKNSNIRLPIQPFIQQLAQLQSYALSGDMQLNTQSLVWTPEGLLGNADVQLLNIQSSLSPSKKLGDYTLALRAKEKGYLLDISTQAGILNLTGKGEGQAKKHWDINVTVKIPPELQGELSALTQQLGPPSVDGSYTIGYKF